MIDRRQHDLSQPRLDISHLLRNIAVPPEASMLGFGDFGVTLAFLATLGSALLCIGYGVLHWNDEDDGRGGRRQP
jgi:hypothetical protein